MADSTTGTRAVLKSLPSVSDLLLEYNPDSYRVPRKIVLAILRGAINSVRDGIIAGERYDDSVASVRVIVDAKLTVAERPNIKKVINGTGVVLHTGLGRAPIGREVLSAAVEAVSSYTNLEIDLDSGKRGERLSAVDELIVSLTGSDGVVVVNNNAAAVLLMLNTVAQGKEVIISRGQQVEIGGSFRIPDVIDKAQAIMVEVGTTNRTHVADYEKAITDETAAILFVHPSNYRVEGFTSEVSVEELSRIAAKKKIPLLVDLGSGSILEQAVPNSTDEPSIAATLKSGASLVSFSGDKLLGGPQAGLVTGRKKWLRELHKNALYRALRCDKLTIALLEQTLRTYGDGKHFHDENLTLQLLHRDRQKLDEIATRIIGGLGDTAKVKAEITIVESTVEAGSGSLPRMPLESVALAIKSDHISPAKLAESFRQAEAPVLGYIKRGVFYLDLKAVPENDIDPLTQTMNEVLSSIR